MNCTYNKLRGKIVERYETQANFARAIGISTNALSSKMTGKAGISQADMELWSELLEIDRKMIWEYFFT